MLWAEFPIGLFPYCYPLVDWDMVDIYIEFLRYGVKLLCRSSTASVLLGAHSSLSQVIISLTMTATGKETHKTSIYSQCC